VTHADTPLAPAWTKEEFEQRLRERGRSYHIHHPFNVMLNSGHATPEPAMTLMNSRRLIATPKDQTAAVYPAKLIRWKAPGPIRLNICFGRRHGRKGSKADLRQMAASGAKRSFGKLAMSVKCHRQAQALPANNATFDHCLQVGPSLA